MFPADIEHELRARFSDLGRVGAVFAAIRENDPGADDAGAIVITHEVDGVPSDRLPKLAAELRHLVVREFGADVASVLLLPAGTVAADTVVFTTTAGTPYVHTPFKPGQLALNLSLRDLAPEVILAASNVFDDVEHCMKADTSPHLAEQATGGRAFVTGTLAGVLNGEVTVPDDQPVVFSPFGLGVLDLALGAFVHQAGPRRG